MYNTVSQTRLFCMKKLADPCPTHPSVTTVFSSRCVPRYLSERLTLYTYISTKLTFTNLSAPFQSKLPLKSMKRELFPTKSSIKYVTDRGMSLQRTKYLYAGFTTRTLTLGIERNETIFCQATRIHIALVAQDPVFRYELHVLT